MTKREFLAVSIGGAALGFQNGRAAFAQSGRSGGIPSRMAKTTRLFKSPRGFSNGLVVTPEGLWNGEQKMSGAQAVAYHLPESKSLDGAAWLVDWNGKLLKTVITPSRNMSGMAVGGGCHAAIWHEGKLWIASLRLRGNLRVDPKT